MAQFDVRQDFVLECDASPEGIGAVLSHDVGGRVRWPIGFHSWVLAVAEKNYLQLQHEASALVFSVLKFQQYLLGKPFTFRLTISRLQKFFIQIVPHP